MKKINELTTLKTRKNNGANKRKQEDGINKVKRKWMS